MFLLMFSFVVNEKTFHKNVKFHLENFHSNKNFN